MADRLPERNDLDLADRHISECRTRIEHQREIMAQCKRPAKAGIDGDF
jgi:hypothetical protein